MGVGADLMTAVDQVDEAIGMKTPEQKAEAAAKPAVPTAAQNDAAMRELQQMMGGIR